MSWHCGIVGLISITHPSPAVVTGRARSRGSAGPGPQEARPDAQARSPMPGCSFQRPRRPQDPSWWERGSRRPGEARSSAGMGTLHSPPSSCWHTDELRHSFYLCCLARIRELLVKFSLLIVSFPVLWLKQDDFYCFIVFCCALFALSNLLASSVTCTGYMSQKENPGNLYQVVLWAPRFLVGLSCSLYLLEFHVYIISRVLICICQEQKRGGFTPFWSRISSL